MSARVNFPEPFREGFDFTQSFVEYSETESRVTVVGYFESVGEKIQSILISLPSDFSGSDHKILPYAEDKAWAYLVSLRTGYALSGDIKELVWNKAEKHLSGKFVFNGKVEGFPLVEFEVARGVFSIGQGTGIKV